MKFLVMNRVGFLAIDVDIVMDTSGLVDFHLDRLRKPSRRSCSVHVHDRKAPLQKGGVPVRYVFVSAKREANNIGSPSYHHHASIRDSSDIHEGEHLQSQAPSNLVGERYACKTAKDSTGRCNGNHPSFRVGIFLVCFLGKAEPIFEDCLDNERGDVACRISN